MATAWDNVARVTSLCLGNSTIFQGSYRWRMARPDIEGDETIKSSIFSIENFGRDKFFFEIKRQVEDTPAETVYFAISLKRDNEQCTVCNCSMVFSPIIGQYNLTGVYMDIEPFVGHETNEIKLMKKQYLQYYSTHERNITILCQFQLTKTLEAVNSGPSANNLSQEMKSLLDNETSTDVILQIGDKCFKAHKLILIARSSVFGKMFENGMKESKDNKVVITDVSEDVFQSLLRYIYTDEIPDLDTLAIHILRVANKYDVIGLKRRCEKYLIENLAISNAAELLIEADSHNAPNLKKKVMQFIMFCRHEFLKTEAYKELRKSNPQLVFDIFEDVE